MSTYVMADIHGDYDSYIRMLELIRFSDSDELIIDGDVIDRGDGGIRILQHMMMQPNIFPIIGNHEYIAMRVMRFLMTEITEQSVEAIRGTLGEDVICELMEWQNIGGQATIDEFHKLDRDWQEDIIEYLGEFVPYMEVRVGDNDFVIVHAGLNNFAPGATFSPDRPLDDYSLEELTFKVPDYETVYFPDKYLVTGHLPTLAIEGARAGCIYKHNRHIAIDCGVGYGGRLGAIRLEDLEEFYI